MLLTKHLLTDPASLFEVWKALKREIPIVPVAVVGGGYDFEEAMAAYSDLQAALDKAQAGAAQELEALLPDKTTVYDVGEKLHASLTALIAISWCPQGSKNQVHQPPIVPRRPLAMHPPCRDRSACPRP